MINYYGVEKEVAEQYIESLNRHIEFVQEAGTMLGVDPIQLKKHDLSKWSAQEFPAYANKFHGEPDELAFKHAWLHHLQNNPHHWNHWLLQNDEDGLEALEMPQHYALEMVADWMGASKAYTGSWDMTEWLKANYNRIHLHQNTREYVSSVLFEMKYSKADLGI